METSKILELEGDLGATIQSLLDEDGRLLKLEQTGRKKLGKISEKIENSLRPQTKKGEGSILALSDRRSQAYGALEIWKELDSLNQRKIALHAGLKDAKSKGTVKVGVQTRDVVGFCRIVEDLLRSWKYPNLGRVVWDSERHDFVIGAKNRGDLGKGYRAFTHAAFSIGLMRYCRKKRLPHPGLVVLDTPLNPLREADEGPGGLTSTEMKDAFYSTLAADKSRDQIIVLENYEPRKTIQKKCRYIRFTKNKKVERYGFFPA